MSKKSLQKRNKSDEEHFKDMVNGSRKVMTKMARESYEYQCDPFHNGNRPRPQRGLARRGDLIDYEMEVTVSVGTAGVGFIVFAPDYFYDENGTILPTGPYVDVNCVSYTDATFAGTTLPAAGTATVVGVNQVAWTASQYSAGSNTVLPRMQWQLNGAGMEIINRTNRLSADGTIYCYQSKNNLAQPSMTPTTLAASRQYTEVSGAVYAENGSKHIFPHKLTSSSVDNQGEVEGFDQGHWNARLGVRSSSNQQTIGGSIIMIKGTAGNSINVRIVAGYSLTGSAIAPKFQFTCDSRSADILDNLISLRYLPSWFGYPSTARRGFLSHAYKFIHDEILSDHEKKGLPSLSGAAKAAGKYLWKELGLTLI